jgi:hypothetical protein
LLLFALIAIMLLPGQGVAYPWGIGGEQTNAGKTIDDVAKEGCLCHQAAPSNSVMILLEEVPHSWVANQSYEMTLHLVGGPEMSSGDTGGFSMRITAGTLAESDMTQNVDENTETLTHTEAGAKTDERSWVITWTAPEAGVGIIEFWISGNSVNGADGNAGDSWNQLTFNLGESDADDGKGTHTLIAGSGEPVAPESTAGGIDLHSMGAPFRAHWLGLLGFGAVICVILFCGFFLRYGASTAYKGRSNLLRLRYKINRRGDQ